MLMGRGSLLIAIRSLVVLLQLRLGVTYKVVNLWLLRLLVLQMCRVLLGLNYAL